MLAVSETINQNAIKEKIMKILCFGASTSTGSINQKLAIYAASFIPEAEVRILDLNDFELPLYSVDREKEIGIPDRALQFNGWIAESDALIISFAEHNGAYTAAFKNLMDWKSRIPGVKIWDNKKMLTLSTSPGRRGGANVLDIVNRHFPHQGAEISGLFSLPSYTENFDEDGGGIINPTLRAEFDKQVALFRVSLGL